MAKIQRSGSFQEHCYNDEGKIESSSNDDAATVSVQPLLIDAKISYQSEYSIVLRNRP